MLKGNNTLTEMKTMSFFEKVARLSTLTELIYLSHVFFLMYVQKLSMIQIYGSQTAYVIFRAQCKMKM